MATRLTPAKRSAEALALLESPRISALFEKVRLASEPPLTPVPRRPSVLPALLGVGLLCAIAWWCCGGLRSGSLRATLPGGSHAGNAAVGETCLYGGDFYPSSGIPSLRQLDAIKTGANSPGSALVARGIAFAVLANWCTVAFDSFYAVAAFNLILCWFGGWLVARTANVLFQDRAKSVFAAICFSLSIVATSFVGEIGPRLLGVCCCYLWTLLLLTKDADDAPVGWHGAIGMAALMGLWSLVDIGSLAGLAIYAAFAFKRRRPALFVVTALAWCLLPIAQEHVWRQLGFAIHTNTDLAHFWTALQQHGSRLAEDPLGYLGFLTIEFANLVFAENPLNVAIGLLGLGLVSHKSKWLLRVCFFAPIVLQMVLLPTTHDRGSAIAGNTIVLFVLVSHLGVEAGRRLQSKFGAQAFKVPLVALAVVQAGWGYADLWGWNFPANALATGAFRELGTVQPTRFARLAGSPREMPTVLDGPVRGPWYSGLATGSARPPVFPIARVAPYRDHWSQWPSLRRLLLAQAPVLASLLIAIVLLMRFWRGLGMVALVSSCAAGAFLCGSTAGFVPASFTSFEWRIAVPQDEKLVGSVRLSPEFQDRLQKAVGGDEQIEFFVRLRPVNSTIEHPAEFQVAEWSSSEPRFTVPAQAFLDAVRARGGRVDFSITAASASKGLLIHSWQTTRTNGERTAQVVHADGTQEKLDRFPSFEIRVVRTKSTYAFGKLIERFEHSHPASYALIGF